MNINNITVRGSGGFNAIVSRPDNVIGLDYILKSSGYTMQDNVVGCIADGAIFDVMTDIPKNARNIYIIDHSDSYADTIIHHSASHILAAAFQTLYPKAVLGYSHETDSSFYYDFYSEIFPSPGIVKEIKKIMRGLINKAHKIRREIIAISDAIKLFENRNEYIKVNKINELISQGRDTVTIYHIGDIWFDLCAGPHLNNTNKIGQFFDILHVMEINKDNGKVAIRVSGSVWHDEKAMNACTQKSSNKRLTHQDINNTMRVFHMQNEAKGHPFWHKNGVSIINSLKEIVDKYRMRDGFQEIITPTLMSKALWEKSGHWDKYRENIFSVKAISDDSSKIQDELLLRPMNCPGAVQVFNASQFSWHDLPVRFTEHGTVFRNEFSGALRGISRTVAIAMDDGHIFCLEEQACQEVQTLVNSITEIYSLFGFKCKICLSTRPEMSIGSEELWESMTYHLKNAINHMPYLILDGEGAFYGPKIEFHIKDAMGRSWQCGTIQLDFNMPHRLNAQYKGADNKPHTPIMIHVASFGSYGRFISILLEHYNGNLPYWLSPVQIVVMPISQKTHEYAKCVFKSLIDSKFRVSLDLDSTTIAYKIKKHNKNKSFCACIVGPEEEASQTVSLRKLFGNYRSISCTIQDVDKVLKTFE